MFEVVFGYALWLFAFVFWHTFGAFGIALEWLFGVELFGDGIELVPPPTGEAWMVKQASRVRPTDCTTSTDT